MKHRRVNQQGVVLLGFLTVAFIVLLQVVQEGTLDRVAGEGGEESALKHSLNQLFRGTVKNGDGDVDLGMASITKSDEVLEEVAQAKNISNFVEIVAKDSPVVVLTYVSYSYKNTLMNWLIAMERVKLRSVAIVCLDSELRDYLFRLGVPCYVPAQKLGIKRSGSKQQLNFKSISKLWVMRMVHLLEILRRGKNVVFSDSDAVWVKNALASGLLNERTGDIVASRGKFPWDVANAWGSTACMGVIFFRSVPNVVSLLEKALEIAVEESDDQVGVNKALFTSFGEDPVHVFGDPLDVYDEQSAVAPATSKLPRLVLLPHSVVPRFCNNVSNHTWGEKVQIAHCHALDGKTAKNFKNWGNSQNREDVMRKYDLLCPEAPIVDTLELHGAKQFSAWLSKTANECDFLKFHSATVRA